MKINEVRSRLNAMNTAVAATTGIPTTPVPSSPMGATQIPFRSVYSNVNDGRIGPSTIPQPPSAASMSHAPLGTPAHFGVGAAPSGSSSFGGSATAGPASASVDTLKERLRARLATQQSSLDREIHAFAAGDPPAAAAPRQFVPAPPSAGGAGDAPDLLSAFDHRLPADSNAASSLKEMQKPLRARIDAVSTRGDPYYPQHDMPDQPAAGPPPQPQPLLSHLKAGFSSHQPLGHPHHAQQNSWQDGGVRSPPTADHGPPPPQQPRGGTPGRQSASAQPAARSHNTAYPQTLGQLSLSPDGSGTQTVALTGAEVFAILRLRGTITSRGVTGEHLLPQQAVHQMAITPGELQQLNQLRELLRSQFRQAPRGAAERRAASPTTARRGTPGRRAHSPPVAAPSDATARWK